MAGSSGLGVGLRDDEGEAERANAKGECERSGRGDGWAKFGERGMTGVAMRDDGSEPNWKCPPVRPLAGDPGLESLLSPLAGFGEDGISFNSWGWDEAVLLIEELLPERAC